MSAQTGLRTGPCPLGNQISIRRQGKPHNITGKNGARGKMAAAKCGRLVESLVVKQNEVSTTQTYTFREGWCSKLIRQMPRLSSQYSKPE
mmetsp:Transcript_2148/g.14178  ORF Transcript_2148/g.14178 Transcript_2148/m.14178 type:complete len:90 (+) Transcript_2148:2878-3147(+)